MGFLDRVRAVFSRSAPAAPATPAGPLRGIGTSEAGKRSTPESEWQAIYRKFWVDATLRGAILDIREMDRLDGRVKKIHLRTARAAAKGGLKLRASSELKKLHREWARWQKRLQLDRREKLESDLRGFFMEGNLPLQWVYGADGNMLEAVRMPAETIVPITAANGQFEDMRCAYRQHDLTHGMPVADFALYQLTMGRLTPDNYDDKGSLGRPYLDSTRAVWRKLLMTEEDLVIRRRMRSPLRMSHTLEGASKEELIAYRSDIEQDQAHGVYRDFYMNKKGAVTALQGDANLDHIADVSFLLDAFYAGGPAPKGLFGYPGELARDVLEDLKRDYYDELDSLQDNTSALYGQGFRIHLLLQGMNPENMDFEVVFAERRTDTPNQRADLALKYQALGLSHETVWEAAGLDPSDELTALQAQRAAGSPYPDLGLAGPELDDPDDPAPRRPKVSVTPGNGRKGESATDISNG